MAKDVITRFKLETTGFDSKIKQAAKDLSAYSKTATQAKEGFNQFTKSNIDAAKVLGTMATSTTNAKDRVKELVGAYNEAAKAYEALSDEQKKSDWAKALAGSLTQLQQRIKEAKAEMQGLGDNMKGVSGGGGLFGGDKLSGMLQVFGGNVMTKIAGMGAGLVTELGDAVKQGIELAKQGEGIRIAFERLGRGDILQGLREATHGTVTDLELMKAAVKFNDFKLPLDELGTMLAFAQQKAKDTGQSVDYMVDSIVTGLGRKSLMILDNLGLSAAQIKEKMAETGDMTKAVGAIIREEMAKAGDYVETAADRATQANVQLENAMTRLGETFQPLSDSATSMWTSIKIGALDLLNNAVKPLIKALQEAGALGQKARGNAGYENLGGDAKINRLIANLGDGKSPKAYRTYKAQMAEFDRYANSLKFKIASYGDDKSGIAQSAVAKLQTELAGVLTMRMEYDRRAQELHKKATAKNIDDNKEEEQSIDSLKKKLAELQEQRKKAIASGDNDLSKNLLKQINQVKADIKGLGGTTTTTTTHKPTTAEQIAFDINKAGISSAKGVDTMPSVYGMADRDAMKSSMNGWNDVGAFLGLPPSIWDAIRKQTGLGYQQYDAKQDISKQWRVGKDGQLTRGGGNNKEKDNLGDFSKNFDQITNSVSGIFNGIEQLGIELPQGLKDVLGGIQVVAGILTAISSLVTIITAIQGTKAVPIIGTFLAGGGMIKAFSGTLVGNTYSGDQLRGIDQSGQLYGLNAGEVVLNRAQVGNLASQLQGVGMQSMQLSAIITGEQLRLVLNNNGRRTGRGEYVTTNFR